MATVKLSPDVNRILYVKNLNYKTTGDDIYDLFGVRPLPPVAPPRSARRRADLPLRSSARRSMARSARCG